MEIVTEPLDPQSPFVPAESKIVVGAAAPGVPDPVPIVLAPGFDCRMREWRNPDTHQIHWRLERESPPGPA